MNAVIDTSSLVALVRNYMPFDQNGNLKKAIQEHYKYRTFTIIDKVYEESRNINDSAIFKILDFIEMPKGNTKPKPPIVIKENILPKKEFFNKVENHFCYHPIKRKLTESEFEVEKEKFLNGADAKMIMYAHNLMSVQTILPEKIIVVTEESPYENDKKTFKKIPIICKMLNIECCTLAELFKEHYRLNLGQLLS